MCDKIMTGVQVMEAIKGAEAAAQAAAKAQRRADLVTLAAAAIGGLAASGSGATDAGMQPLVATACHDPEQFAAIAVRVAEAALDLITERTK